MKMGLTVRSFMTASGERRYAVKPLCCQKSVLSGAVWPHNSLAWVPRKSV